MAMAVTIVPVNICIVKDVYLELCVMQITHTHAYRVLERYCYSCIRSTLDE